MARLSNENRKSCIIKLPFVQTQLYADVKEEFYQMTLKELEDHVKAVVVRHDLIKDLRRDAEGRDEDDDDNEA